MKEESTPKRMSPLRMLRASVVEIFRLIDNWISVIGMMLFAASLIMLTVYWLFSLTGGSMNRYFEAFIVMVMPACFMGALFLIPAGIFLATRREARQGTLVRPDEVKPVGPLFRGPLLILVAITALVVFPVVAVSSYNMYEYSESTQFCGEFCHSVMKPQATAHARSPHARVRCAECHIGSGANFFVKSKISGLRQVYAVLTDSYRRPIPVAITELRPARDTCEECHWPSKFFGTQYKRRTHFSPDTNNSRREVEIMIKTGGASIGTGQAEGIHMHMLAAGTIEYVAADDELQDITWIRHTQKDGSVRIYRKQGADRVANTPGVITRTIDCMDCHNRGAHHFLSPQKALEVELETGRIDFRLPFIMREATSILSKTYTDSARAESEIERRMLKFYREEHPETWSEREKAVRKAIARVQMIYREQFFPKMKEDWRVYPENIGHQLSAGCFRCHDGYHTDDDGLAVTSNCNTCHTFINKSDVEYDCFNLGTFRHSNTLSVHRRVLCSKCHGTGRYRECKECHQGKDWQALRGQGRFRPTDEQGRVIPLPAPEPMESEDGTFRLEATDDSDESKKL